jgi:hypothetical protein
MVAILHHLCNCRGGSAAAFARDAVGAWRSDFLVTFFCNTKRALHLKSFVYFISGAFSGGRDFHYVVV